MELSRPIADCYEICTSLVWGQGWKVTPLLSKIFLPPVKIGVGKPQIYFKYSRTAVSQKCTISKWLNQQTNNSCFKVSCTSLGQCNGQLSLSSRSQLTRVEQSWTESKDSTKVKLINQVGHKLPQSFCFTRSISWSIPHQHRQLYDCCQISWLLASSAVQLVCRLLQHLARLLAYPEISPSRQLLTKQ